MEPRDIRLCDEQGSDGGADIAICSEQNSDVPRDIVICADCNDPAPLSISGDVDVVLGSSYAVAGGVAPYRWQISCGSISVSGIVTDVTGCCGSGLVTVTDACGQSASMPVRFPVGQWVFTGWVKGALDRTTYSSCNGGSYTCIGYGDVQTCDDTNGASYNEHVPTSADFSTCYNLVCYDINYYECDEVYEWRCP